MKKIIFMLVSLILTISLFSMTAKADVDLCQNAKSAILIEEKTGTILYEKNKDFRLAPASMTKVMTLAIIFDYIKAGKLKYTDMIETSEHASGMGGSQVYLSVGEKLSLDEMLKCISICSANDAAVAVSEKVAGSETAFVGLMNKKALDLGLKNTNFMDVTGLETKNHYTSAYDMAFMAKYLLNNHQNEVLKYTSMREDYIRKDTEKPFWLVNTNKLIGRTEGVDGLKTGWTVAAGYCLTATMKKDNNRLISVAMGYEKPLVRNSESVEMLNYGFASFRFETVLKSNHVVKEVYNIKYNPSKFIFVTKDSVSYMYKVDESSKDVRYEFVPKENSDSFKENEIVGKLNIYVANKLYTSVDVVCTENIEKNNLFNIFLEILKMVFI